MPLKNRVSEICEGNVTAEIYEKVRERDGKRFYDIVIVRAYHDDNNFENKTEFLQWKDLDNLVIVTIRARQYINQQLWEDRHSTPPPPSLQ